MVFPKKMDDWFLEEWMWGGGSVKNCMDAAHTRRRFIAESPKCKDAPNEARPPLRSRGRAVLVNGELCLIDQPHAVVFARPSAVQAYPGRRPGCVGHSPPCRDFQTPQSSNVAVVSAVWLAVHPSFFISMHIFFALRLFLGFRTPKILHSFSIMHFPCADFCIFQLLFFGMFPQFHFFPLPTRCDVCL